MKSKRSKACDFKQSVRKQILERDGGCCINCGSTYLLGIAHLVPRSKGGLGIVENGACLCARCHSIADQGYHLSERLEMNQMLRDYLESLYPCFTDEERTYKKYGNTVHLAFQATENQYDLP